jgi:hypothetical protein
LFEVLVRPSHPSRRLAAVVVFATSLVAGACAERGQLGARCAVSDDCAVDLQCLSGLCTARCEHHVECGDGYLCDDGTCREVSSAIGDPCAREIDCAPGQACTLDTVDVNGDGDLGATCQLQGQGEVLRESCTVDDDCRSGTCALGLCTELCTLPSDCPPGTTCARMPRLEVAGAPLFAGCLPSTGIIEHRFDLDGPEATLAVPVPSSARSFALVAESDERGVVVGATQLSDPDGRVLYRQPDANTPEQYFANPIRYQPQRAVSTLFMPNSPDVVLATGVYQVEVSSRFSTGQLGHISPSVKVLYKVDSGATLDLHVVFVDLADHPCREAWGGGALDAATAATLPEWRGFIAGLDTTFRAAGITLGEVTYRDLDDRADLARIGTSQLGDLLSLATDEVGLTVFVVRSLTPTGVQALAGAVPVPPRTPATPSSGIAVSAETLCYRSWQAMSRLTAHQLAAAMGLYRNREPDGHTDPVDDSDGSSDNLMYFGEFGGLELSPGQAAVLRRYPGLR